MKNKRGAQPGNKNSYKHGFYSSAFKARERSLLAHVPIFDLTAEIELIRLTSFRFLKALNAAGQPLDFETQLSALRAVNLSAQSIVGLMRAQALTASAARDADSLAETLRHLEGDLQD